jgi:hypothetical protein
MGQPPPSWAEKPSNDSAERESWLSAGDCPLRWSMVADATWRHRQIERLSAKWIRPKDPLHVDFGARGAKPGRSEGPVIPSERAGEPMIQVHRQLVPQLYRHRFLRDGPIRGDELSSPKRSSSTRLAALFRDQELAGHRLDQTTKVISRAMPTPSGLTASQGSPSK